MKTLIKALLGASLLVPVAAQAQDQDRSARRAEWRAQRAARPEQQQQAQPRAPDGQRGGERAGWRNAPPPQSQAEAQARFQAAQNRGDRGNWRGAPQPQPQVQAQVDAQARFQAGRQQREPGTPGYDRFRGQNRAGFAGRDGNRFEGRADAQGFARDDRSFADPTRVGGDRRIDRRDDRQDYVRDQQRRGWPGNNDRRGGNATNYGRYAGNDQHQVWNRTWRNDNRYDWNRYRSGNSSLYRLPRYYAPYGYDAGYRRFSIGVTLSSVLWDQSYWIDDPYEYRLPEAYGPYRWVRYYDDALLVDLRTGRVIDTVYDIFY